MGKYERLWNKGIKKISLPANDGIIQNAYIPQIVTTALAMHLEYADNPSLHPLAAIDRGLGSVDCTTILSTLEPNDIAALMMNVNDNATITFIQQIRGCYRF